MLAFSQAHGSAAGAVAAGAVAFLAGVLAAVAFLAAAYKILVVVAFGLAAPAFDTKQ